jgi:hypothetical protein
MFWRSASNWTPQRQALFIMAVLVMAAALLHLDVRVRVRAGEAVGWVWFEEQVTRSSGARHTFHYAKLEPLRQDAKLPRRLLILEPLGGRLYRMTVALRQPPGREVLWPVKRVPTTLLEYYPATREWNGPPLLCRVRYAGFDPMVYRCDVFLPQDEAELRRAAKRK